MITAAPATMLPEAVAPDLLKLPDRISDTFQGQNIFITGGTGLIGQLLIDKILRCCRGIKMIYLLVRPKNGRTLQERVDDLFKTPLFALLNSDKSYDYRLKICPIQGDVSLDGLGISSEDRQTLLEEVNIVYHGAANVRFDETLKEMIITNVRGCKFMLELANEMKNLQLYVHVSTAYAHTPERIIEEKMYNPAVDPHDALKLIELLSGDMLETITTKYIGDYPNTYAFSKACSEGLVNEEIRRGKLPLILVRPSIVLPTMSHPLPGWTNRKYGPMAVVLGAAKGVMRTIYLPKRIVVDLLPADVAVNFLCVVAFAYTFFPERRKDLSVINFTTSSSVKLTWYDVIDMFRSIAITVVPLNWAVWYPGGAPTANYSKYHINFVLKQFIPALIIDAILFCCGSKPALVNIQKRIYSGCNIFQFYMSNEWKFVNDKISDIYVSMLNQREIATYPSYGLNLYRIQYYINVMYGMRRYLLNERDESLPTAKRHIKVMYIVDKLFQLLLIYLVYWVFCKVIM